MNDQVRGRGAHNKDRRTQILDAAEELIAEGGFAAASVRAVAGRAGIGASTMRYWFPSQESLTTAIARRALTLQLRDERIADQTLPPADRLTECLAQFLPADEGHRTQAQGWFALIASAVGPASTALGRSMLGGMLSTTRDKLTSWLNQLAAEGALDEAAVPRAATALLTRIDGLTLGLILPNSQLDVPAAHAILRDDVRGIFNDSGPLPQP